MEVIESPRDRRWDNFSSAISGTQAISLVSEVVDNLRKIERQTNSFFAKADRPRRVD
jgi:hypothetical protein